MEKIRFIIKQSCNLHKIDTDSGVLSIIQETDGYKECFLKQNSTNESSMTDNPAHCLPMKKPENCAEDAWYELSMLKKNEELNVEQCPVIEGKPKIVCNLDHKVENGN